MPGSEIPKNKWWRDRGWYWDYILLIIVVVAVAFMFKDKIKSTISTEDVMLIAR